MSWQGILGHDEIANLFRRSLQQHRLATTFLFVGPEGIGKRTFALKLAQTFQCSQSAEEHLEPCGACPECKQVQSDSHPDLQFIRKPVERAYIPVETFIGDREHRMRSGLCHFISLTPSGGKRRVAIVDDADWLNQEGANSLLKTLEEPSPGAIIILIGTSAQRQLPTIRSRSQIVRFRPLTNEQVAEILLAQNLAESPEQAKTMAARAGGSVSRAIALAGDEVRELRSELWKSLAMPILDRQGLSKTINEFVDAGGKETAAKRQQLRIVFDAAIDYYRALARRLAGGDVEDIELQNIVEPVAAGGATSVEIASSQLDRCLDAIRQVSANANVSMLIDAVVCDLAVMTREQTPLQHQYP